MSLALMVAILDVNSDGQVTVVDLAIGALFYGTQVPIGVSLPADVNADDVVNLLDLMAIAQAIDAQESNVAYCTFLFFSGRFMTLFSFYARNAVKKRVYIR